jgi:hypothetical protein
MNKVVKAKHIENIDSWTDAFLNYAKILVVNHTTMASELFTYMSIIKGAIISKTASFEIKIIAFSLLRIVVTINILYS